MWLDLTEIYDLNFLNTKYPREVLFKLSATSQDMIHVAFDVLQCINMRDKIIQYFDSMGGGNNACLMALKQYLEDESMDKKKQPFDTSDWTLECVTVSLNEQLTEIKIHLTASFI